MLVDGVIKAVGIAFFVFCENPDSTVGRAVVGTFDVGLYAGLRENAVYLLPQILFAIIGAKQHQASILHTVNLFLYFLISCAASSPGIYRSSASEKRGMRGRRCG